MVHIPTVDLSPFMNGGDSSRRKMVINTINHACTHYGVFQIENHGISLGVCERLMALTKKFFKYPEKEKKGFTFVDNYMVPGNGYHKKKNHHHDYEYLLMHSPTTGRFNGAPPIPLGFRDIFQEVYQYFLETSQILEEIINDCLELPPHYLKRYNNERSGDCLLAMKYQRSSNNENIGIFKHQDENMFSIVLEDEVEGLEVCINNQWIPIIPERGKLVVIIGDLLQVLSNKKFRNVTHRAWKHMGRDRHAIVFSHTLPGDKFVHPLYKLTRAIGVEPKYEGFKYKDYLDLKAKDEMFNLTFYELQS